MRGRVTTKVSSTEKKKTWSIKLEAFANGRQPEGGKGMGVNDLKNGLQKTDPSNTSMKSKKEFERTEGQVK